MVEQAENIVNSIVECQGLKKAGNSLPWVGTSLPVCADSYKLLPCRRFL